MSNSSIMIIDEHPIMRHGLRNLVETEKKFIVAAETNNGAEAINIASKIQPDIIMMDINTYFYLTFTVKNLNVK